MLLSVLFWYNPCIYLLIQFYQKIIYQQVENVQADLSIEVQQHLANIM